MWHDLRQAVRTLAKHPAFVLLSASVLALGIGLNTAMFSIVRSLLFTPLPVPASHELVSIYQVFPRQPDRPTVLSNRQYRFLDDHNEVFSAITAHWGLAFSLRAADETDVVNGAWVLSNYFAVLGASPILGRTLAAPEDDVANPARAVVISHALWARRFRSDPDIVGKNVEIGLWGQTYVTCTVVGVMAPEFKGVSAPWKPVHLWVTFAQGVEMPATAWSGAVIGRLRPGTSIEQARAVVSAQVRQEYYSRARASPENEPRLVLYATDSVKTPFDPAAVVIPRRLAGAMTMVVALVLLVAAANIAGILMARGVGRSSEIAIRRALGAGPVRIVRQLLAESLLVALGGGVLGLLLARGLVHLFGVFTPMQFTLDVSIDGQVVAFTVGICVVAGVITAVLPARQAGRLAVLPWLSGAPGFQTTATTSAVRHAITIPQAAVSLVLLLTAGVYIRALLTIELADVGYQPRNLLVASVSLMTAPELRPQPRMSADLRRQLDERYAARARQFYDRLFERVRAMPGTTDAAITYWLPLHEPAERPDWSVVSHEALLDGQRDGSAAERSSVSPGYFATLGIRLVEGRDFDARDTRTTPKVAVVSAALARSLWPGRPAIGRTLALVSGWNTNEEPALYDVVGVVSEVSPIVHERPVRPFIYLPLSQQWRPAATTVLVRGSGDSRTLIPAIRDAVQRADGLADVYRVRTMPEMIGEIMYPRRIAGAVLAVSGLVALLLATIGVYGVVSFAVAQRTGEIGVRMALGADRRDIVRLVLRDGALIAIWGSVAGMALGYAAIRVTSSRFVAQPQIDLLTMLAMPLVLGAVILLACYLPARRAGRIDPLQVLRQV